MRDWNHDGKIDFQDHAFYNNVVEPGAKKSETSSTVHGSNKSSTTPSPEESRKGFTIFIGFCALYLIIKFIGG